MSVYDQSREDVGPHAGVWASPARLVLIGFLTIGGVYLWMEHRAHPLGALIWLPLLACPLMHLFMHHGHGEQGGRGQDRGEGGRT